MKEMKLNVENVQIPEEAGKEAAITIAETKRHIPDRNDVSLNGTLAHISEFRDRLYFIICTRTGKNKEALSFVNVQIPAALTEKCKEFKQGEHLLVTAQLKSYKVLKDNAFRTVVEAVDVKRAVSELEEQFGVSGRVFDESYNRFYVGGEITRSMTTKRGSYKLTVKTDSGDGKPKYLNCSLFARNPKKVAPQLVVGNRICAVGEIRTFVDEAKEEGGKKTHSQEYILLDILEI